MRPSRSFAGRAFTLVELLVVIGIIALLIAILFPVLSKVRTQAQLVHCAANLRSIHQAAMLCAGEHRGWVQPIGVGGDFPKPTDPGYPGFGDTNRTRFSWFPGVSGDLRSAPVTAVLARYMGIAPLIGTRAEIEAALASASYAKVFACPADQPPVPHPTLFHWSVEDTIREPTSYAFNDAVIGVYSEDHRLFVGRLTDAFRSSEVVLIVDINSQQPNFAWFMGIGKDRSLWDVEDMHYNPPSGHSEWESDAYNPHGGGITPGNPFDAARHRGRMNVIFVDGHGETITISQPHSALKKGDLERINVSRDIRTGLRDL